MMPEDEARKLGKSIRKEDDAVGFQKDDPS